MLINKQHDLADILEELPNVHRQGDNLVFEHQYDVTTEAEFANWLREHSNNGFTNEREFRQIGSIPLAVWEWVRINRPDLVKDYRLLKKWLMTDEGAPWRTVSAIDTGHSGQVIVK